MILILFSCRNRYFNRLTSFSCFWKDHPSLKLIFLLSSRFLLLKFLSRSCGYQDSKKRWFRKVANSQRTGQLHRCHFHVEKTFSRKIEKRRNTAEFALPPQKLVTNGRRDDTFTGNISTEAPFDLKKRPRNKAITSCWSIWRKEGS